MKLNNRGVTVAVSVKCDDETRVFWYCGTTDTVSVENVKDIPPEQKESILNNPVHIELTKEDMVKELAQAYINDPGMYIRKPIVWVHDNCIHFIASSCSAHFNSSHLFGTLISTEVLGFSLLESMPLRLRDAG